MNMTVMRRPVPTLPPAEPVPEVTEAEFHAYVEAETGIPTPLDVKARLDAAATAPSLEGLLVEISVSLMEINAQFALIRAALAKEEGRP